MSDFVFFTDSACDLSTETLADWGVKSVELTFRFNDDEVEHSDFSMKSKDFYDGMRNGRIARTSAVNVDAFKQAFAAELEKGKDIFYLAFSSGLSTTYNSGRLAADELRGEYPDRKILVVDSLSASAGMGLLLYLTVKKAEAGATIEEAADYAEKTKLSICHWFTVGDLRYLKRGGRISPTLALVGTLIGIKPVLHTDNEGHLVNVTKVRGRAAAIKALADKFGETAVDKTKGPVFICHGDCIEDAETLAEYIKNDYGVDVEIITNVGPVIGAHSGPGTLAIFFIGTER